MSSTDTELTDLVLDIIDRKQDPQDRMDTIQGILEDDMNRGQMIKLLSVLAETYAKQEKFIETVVTYSALAIFRQKGDKPSEKEIKERLLGLKPSRRHGLYGASAKRIKALTAAAAIFIGPTLKEYDALCKMAFEEGIPEAAVNFWQIFRNQLGDKRFNTRPSPYLGKNEEQKELEDTLFNLECLSYGFNPAIVLGESEPITLTDRQKTFQMKRLTTKLEGLIERKDQVITERRADYLGALVQLCKQTDIPENRRYTFSPNSTEQRYHEAVVEATLLGANPDKRIALDSYSSLSTKQPGKYSINRTIIYCYHTGLRLKDKKIMMKKSELRLLQMYQKLKGLNKVRTDMLEDLDELDEDQRTIACLREISRISRTQTGIWALKGIELVRDYANKYTNLQYETGGESK